MMEGPFIVGRRSFVEDCVACDIVELSTISCIGQDCGVVVGRKRGVFF